MTTVFAVGAVIVGLPQVSLCLIILATGHCSFCPINGPMWQFFAMPPTHTTPNSSNSSDKGLTPKKSAFEPFSVANSVDNTKLAC